MITRSLTALAPALILAVTACGTPTGSASESGAPKTDAPPSLSSPVGPADTSAPTPSPSRSPSGSAAAGGLITLEGTSAPDAPYGAVQMFVNGADALVVIGFDGGSGSFVWESSDEGRTWTPVAPPQAYVTAIAELEGRHVGVGGLPMIADAPPVVAVWLSADGRDWDVELPGDAIEGTLNDIVADADGFVAVGQGWHAPGMPGAWMSPDGRAWTAVDTGSVPGVFNAVIRGGAGLVATGAAGESQNILAVWTSDDGGLTWTIGPALDGGAGMVAEDIVTHGAVMVLVAHPVLGGDARIWTSTDGTAWTPAGGLPSPGFVRSLVSTSHGLVAVGGDGILDARAWISADGTEWTTLAELPNAYFETALEVGSRLVIGGASQFPIGGTQSTRSFASIWIGELGR